MMMHIFNVLTSVSKAASFREHTASDATLLEDEVDIFQPHVFGFGEEAVRDGHDDTGIQDGKDDVSE